MVEVITTKTVMAIRWLGHRMAALMTVTTLMLRLTQVKLKFGMMESTRIVMGYPTLIKTWMVKWRLRMAGLIVTIQTRLFEWALPRFGMMASMVTVMVGPIMTKTGTGYTIKGAPSGSSDDCDDTSGGYLINPGVDEIWYDGVDQDCDGWSDYDQDLDTDDHDAFGGTDCDDDDADVSGLESEVRDGKDNDCDTKCDEGLIGEGDLVITEIMRNPEAVSDSLGEWFEIYNVTGTDIRMCADWAFEDDGGDWFDVESIVLDSGQRLQSVRT